MSNQSPLSVPTEIMQPGQTSDALRVKLKQVGSRITDQQITAAWKETEASRVSFSCAAVALGVMLRAKKEAIGHGKWLAWCQKFGSQLATAIAGKNETRFAIAQEVTPRTLQHYTFVAEHFMSSLEQGEFTGEVQDHKPKLEGVTADQVLAIDNLPAKDRKAVFGRIEQFVAGRSLRTMLIDFRRAETAADQEEADEANRKRKKSASDAGATPGQLDFWDEIKVKLDAITNIVEAPSTVKHATKAFWAQLAVALEEQAKVARQREKEMTS
jgi:hypothetical protein